MAGISIALGSIGTVAVIYLIRKIREYQWGWVRDKYSLQSRIFIVTGASSGLGYQTTLALADRDATVIMACRNLDKANEATSAIRRKTGKGKLIVMELDLASFDSIRSFANEINEKYPKFYSLIANAGVVMKNAAETKDGVEMHVGVNHLGHFLLTMLLKENIRNNNSRIVIVSSSLHEKASVAFEKDPLATTTRSHTNPMYANSKLLNFYFARHLYAQNYDVYVVCPGFCYTELFRDFNMPWYSIFILPLFLLVLRSAKQGAQSIIHCATSHQHTEKENPMTGYYVKDLKEKKSKYAFSAKEQETVWNNSERLCHLVE